MIMRIGFVTILWLFCFSAQATTIHKSMLPADIDASNLATGSVTNDEILDNTIGLADWESGTDGNLITFDAAGDPAYVATGTAGHVLTSNGAGAAPTFQASGKATGADGIISIKQEATYTLTDDSGAGKTFTAPSGWTITGFEISISGQSNATSGKAYIQIGPSGGVETSSYSGGTGDAGTNTAIGGTGWEIDTDTTAASSVTGLFRARLHDSSSNTWVHDFNGWDDGSTRAVHSGGSKAIAGALNKVAFVPSANTFDAGTIIVVWYGYE